MEETPDSAFAWSNTHTHTQFSVSIQLWAFLARAMLPEIGVQPVFLSFVTVMDTRKITTRRSIVEVVSAVNWQDRERSARCLHVGGDGRRLFSDATIPRTVSCSLVWGSRLEGTPRTSHREMPNDDSEIPLATRNRRDVEPPSKVSRISALIPVGLAVYAPVSRRAKSPVSPSEIPLIQPGREEIRGLRSTGWRRGAKDAKSKSVDDFLR